MKEQLGSKRGWAGRADQEGGWHGFWGVSLIFLGAPNLVSLETQKQKQPFPPEKNKTKPKKPTLQENVVGCVHTQDCAVSESLLGSPGSSGGQGAEGPWGRARPSQLTELSVHTRMPNRGLSYPVHTMCCWGLTDPRCERRWAPVPSIPPQNSCSLVRGGGDRF